MLERNFFFLVNFATLRAFAGQDFFAPEGMRNAASAVEISILDYYDRKELAKRLRACLKGERRVGG